MHQLLMRQPILRCLAMVGVLTGLAACVTSGDAELGKKDKDAAASYNTELGVNYLRQGNLNEAKNKLDRALEQNPRSAQANFFAGLLYDRLGENKKSDSYYSRAVDLDPKNSEILNGYAVFLCRKGDRDKGEKLALEAAENPLYKTPEVALTNAGNCALDEGRATKAEQYFRRALKSQPNFTPALLQMAELELKASNWLPARAFLERYQQAARPSAASLWLGVRIELGLGNNVAAADYARRLKQDFPTADETKALLELERKNNS